MSSTKSKKEVEVWIGMTVEELARAMEKDVGEPDNFIRKNMRTWITQYFICNKIKTFKDEN